MSQRTTITLEDDVADRLREESRRTGKSFKDVVNEALRAGLATRPRARPYRVQPRRMGLRPGVDLDRAMHLAFSLEDEEIVRKLELRK